MKGAPDIRSRSGQTMVFMIMVLVILCFMLLWHFDLHKIIYVKTLSQNAGDAAALNAARWQGITLNLVGDLNIMKAVALTEATTNSPELIEQIDEIQAHLCYVGPMIALLGAQQAAKNNGIFNNGPFTSELTDHANAVRDDYGLIFAEPYDGCWMEYSSMLESIAGQGVAAGPDNASYYTDYSGPHTLLNMNFYDAVAGRDWCWFWGHDLALLEDYTDYTFWPDLPPMEAIENSPLNSEIFGLWVTTQSSSVPGGTNTVDLMNALAQERALSTTTITNDLTQLDTLWYCFDSSRWTSWTAISRDGADPFPVLGDVYPQYDYAGADAAVRVIAEADRVTPGRGGSEITWTAAAKPFGYLDEDGNFVPPTRYGIVLPAFREVRLIALDASSRGTSGSYDLAWREHIEAHLPAYMDGGVDMLDPDCWYCRQLDRWEDSSFRQDGIDWLEETDEFGELVHDCVTHGGPGGPGGGTRTGH